MTDPSSGVVRAAAGAASRRDLRVVYDIEDRPPLAERIPLDAD